MNTRETRKVSYIDWQDDEGNCGTSYAIILEAESKEEAEAADHIQELENALEMCLDFFEGCQVEGEDDPDVCQTICAQQARLLLYNNH